MAIIIVTLILCIANKTYSYPTHQKNPINFVKLFKQISVTKFKASKNFLHCVCQVFHNKSKRIA